MVLAEIGTGVISAYFFRHITSAYSLNVSDPIEGQPVQLSYYLCVFGCGLVFWLLVLLRAKLHGSGDRQADIRKVAKLAKLITSITTVNLCGCLLAPLMKLPLLVRFLVLFQVSSNLALLLIWAFLLLDTHAPQKSSPNPLVVYGSSFRIPPVVHGSPCSTPNGWSPLRIPKRQRVRRMIMKLIELFNCLACLFLVDMGRLITTRSEPMAVHNVDGVGGKVDEAGGSGSGHGSGASGREENRGRYGGNDGGGGAGGGGDRGESGSGHGSGASGSGENSGGYGGHGRDEGGTGSGHGSGAGGNGENRGKDEGHGQDEGGTGSGHGSGAGGSGENRGGSEGGDRRWDGGGGDPECGVRGTNTEQAFKSSGYSITEMSLMLTAQTTSTLIGFHVIPTPSSSSKAFLVVALMDQLVAYLCGLTSIMLISSNKPEAAEIFEKLGFVCTALGFILMVAMFVPWEFVLIAVLLFGVVWFFFFRNDLKTNLKKCIGMPSESGR